MSITVHAYIAVTDLERGIEFYCQALVLRLEQMATALMAWGDAPDTFYARPVFTAIGWA